jgi:hypothetical protein
LTLTISTTGTELNLASAESEAAASVEFSPGASVSFGQSLSNQGGQDNAAGTDGEKAGETEDVATNPASSSASPWERFILGLDEALERFRREFQGRILGPQDQATDGAQPKAKPSADASPPIGPTSLRSTPCPPPTTTGDKPTRGPNATDQVEAFDATIDSIWGGVEVSSPLIIAAMMTGWTVVAGPRLARSNFNAKARERTFSPTLGSSVHPVRRSQGVIDCCERRRVRASAQD